MLYLEMLVKLQLNYGVDQSQDIQYYYWLMALIHILKSQTHVQILTLGLLVYL